MEVYEEYPHTILGVQEVAEQKIANYGVISPVPVTANIWQVKDLVEKPAVEEAPSRLAILGRYIIDAAIFPLLAETLPGKNGEIQLTDALRQLAAQKPVYAFHFEGCRFDVGDKLGYLEATVELALKRPELRAEFLRYLAETVASAARE